ncbi:hypothetical protein GCM10022219_11520 [Microbacterium oryzae]|uniref:Uncharacterized protein n=2 Tax=Microbacterium oryzae TaxID=743009 RepID=A0A6I6DWE6_9MICO|nr:hypothetical protein D7D94_12940 [Microbacterium oryzae]
MTDTIIPQTPDVVDSTEQVGDLHRFCLSQRPERGTRCLKEPGHDGTEHSALTETWEIDPDSDQEWGAAFIARRPDISAIVPAWADEVYVSHVAIDGSVWITMETTFGDFEVADVAIWRDGDVDRSSMSGPEGWFPGVENGFKATKRKPLARVLRDRAITMLVAAQRLEQAEEVAA